MSKNLKKEKFNKRSNNNSVYIISGVAIALIIAVVAFISFGGGNDQTAANGGSVTGTSTSNGTKVQEVTVTPTVAGDKLIIKKSDVEKNEIIKFDYTGVKLALKSGAKVDFPLLAYVTPSGKINVAVRMCEPCNGLSFSIIDGKILHCNTCNTEWDLESNQYIQGTGSEYCGSFAPEIKPATINGDNIEIKIADFKDWLPRA